ncbi:MAG: MMPL family transporter [Lachnospiraceae bacterium]|nr:MMPL family transporter [Lachnospiraceae bacterium]
MNNKKKDEGNSFWYSVANFIVNKRKAVELLFVFAIVYSLICMNKVKVNQDITSYLPAESETRVGLSTMEEEVTTYGSAKIMLTNVTYEQAEEFVNSISGIKGIKEIAFDETSDHLRGTNALINVTVDGGNEDAISLLTMEQIENKLAGYDSYILTSIGSEEKNSESLNHDMNIILVLAVVIIVAVLIISTMAFAEIPVLLITFGVAALLNMGTNYLLGTISSVTKSIAVVLQLALAIDYAIILCDRYMEEHETLEPVEAVKVALSKAIPEISSSSLTTVSGMLAMMFMQFKLGFDMGLVLIKAILLSLISVFFLMPGIILIFSKWIDKSRHKCFVPHVKFVGKFASATKYFFPPIFVVIIIMAFFSSSNCLYLYDTNSVESAKKNEAKIATEKIESAFGSDNQLVVLVPAGDYESEAKALNKIEKLDYVSSALGLANQKINDDYYLTDKITSRQFAELTNLDVEVVNVLYSAYAYNQEQYGPMVTGIDDYEIPIIDLFLFLYDQYQQGYVSLDSEMDEYLTDLYDTLHEAQLQLQGENYSRFVLNIEKPVEGEETYKAMDEIRAICGNYYGQENVLMVGNSTSARDLQDSFATDNIVISVLTILFVVIILFFTFQSAGLPLLLVLTIQGSIWINFTVPSLQGQGVYFIAYLIVSAIQMGATIDYAIVISSRYMELKKEMPLKEAIGETIDKAFPTIFTSGTILTSAGFLIGNISSDATVAAIGIALGRGTLISILLVLFVLPQILILGDTIIEKTALTINLQREQKEAKGKMNVTGHIHGYVNGMIDADVNGVVQGEMKVVVDTIIKSKKGNIEEIGYEEE